MLKCAKNILQQCAHLGCRGVSSTWQLPPVVDHLYILSLF